MIMIGFAVFLLISLVLSLIVIKVPIAPENKAAVAGLVQAAAGIISAILIVFQLSEDRESQKHLADIQEADFIFRYNQSFIDNERIASVQNLLVQELNRDLYGPGRTNNVIDDSNRQDVVTYLVYLESLAPMVINNIMSLDKLDDLLSLRFFLAVNNPEVQEKHLLKYPNDYRGCFKLYKIWKEYKKRK